MRSRVLCAVVFTLATSSSGSALAQGAQQCTASAEPRSAPQRCCSVYKATTPSRQESATASIVNGTF